MALDNLQYTRAYYIITNKLNSDNVNELYTIIYENGLLNALAYAQKKYTTLYGHIFDYIKAYDRKTCIFDFNSTTKEEFITILLNKNAHEHRHLHQEIIRFLDAIKTYGISIKPVMSQTTETETLQE